MPVLAIAVAMIAGCGGDGKSSSGGGSSSAAAAPAPVNVVGPNLNGNWAGYYKSSSGKYEGLRATITHVGAQVTITTTKKAGVARQLSGRISAVGKMVLYDAFDGEDWTTLYGPASPNSINLADFVFLNGHIVDTNVLILKR